MSDRTISEALTQALRAAGYRASVSVSVNNADGPLFWITLDQHDAHRLGEELAARTQRAALDTFEIKAWIEPQADREIVYVCTVGMVVERVEFLEGTATARTSSVNVKPGAVLREGDPIRVRARNETDATGALVLRLHGRTIR